MLERDHAINKFLCLPLTFLLIIFSFIVEETSGESFPLEQRRSSFGLGGNGTAKWLWKRRKNMKNERKIHIYRYRFERRYFNDASVKYEGEILVISRGPVVVSSIRFRLYTEMEQRNVERTRGNGTRWNAIPPWLLSNVNDHTAVYREKLVYHITKRTEYFFNNVHRTCNRFWLINKSFKYSILLIKHHCSCRRISYRFKFHSM